MRNRWYVLQSIVRLLAPTRGPAMYFNFGTRKIVEAVAVLLQSAPNRRMGVLRLLKLLYIADRESLREVRRPIVGTELAAMRWGPLHGKIYDLTKGSQHREETWDNFIGKRGRDIVLMGEPGCRTLSRYEMDKLKETAKKYRNTSDGELSVITHQFPEWVKNDPGNSSKPIPMHDVLEAVGLASEEKDILKDAKRVATFNRLFGVPS